MKNILEGMLINYAQYSNTKLSSYKKVYVVDREKSFDVNDEFSHLSLWVRATGDVKVWLNGVEVFSQEVKQTRQYNQYNISNYCRYLRKGKNELKIEVRETKKMSFDFGLRAY